MFNQFHNDNTGKLVLRLSVGILMLFHGIRMSEIMDLRKEKNFFETRVIEYQTGGALSWD